jgi:hypothetical protein
LPPTVEVPDLSGKELTLAINTLADKQLKLGVRSELPSETVPEEQIIEQSPEAGMELEAGSLVSVIVSSGPHRDDEGRLTARVEQERSEDSTDKRPQNPLADDDPSEPVANQRYGGLPQETSQRLLRHVFDTYNSLRLGMAAIAFAFPILLYVVGRLNGLSLQGSMSAYYWASVEGDPPVRVWFVGGIFVIGSFLFLYKGYTFLENWALNVAAVLIILVALFPMSWKCGSEFGHCPSVNPHSWFAIAFFACVVYVALGEAGKTLDEIQDQALKQRYGIAYWFTRASLIIFPVAAVTAHLLTRNWDALTYSLELAGIWAFAFFWLVKSLELRRSQGFERQVMREARGAIVAS